jgi:hypothetical protein
LVKKIIDAFEKAEVEEKKTKNWNNIRLSISKDWFL